MNLTIYVTVLQNYTSTNKTRHIFRLLKKQTGMKQFTTPVNKQKKKKQIVGTILYLNKLKKKKKFNSKVIRNLG